MVKQRFLLGEMKNFIICDDINQKPIPFDKDKIIVFYEKTLKRKSNMKNYDLKPIVDLLDESIKKLTELQNKKTDVLICIPENTSYQDFAKEVAKVLVSDYGTHNIHPFIEELMEELSTLKIGNNE